MVLCLPRQLEAGQVLRAAPPHVAVRGLECVGKFINWSEDQLLVPRLPDGQGRAMP